jgi:hypothetical protein
VVIITTVNPQISKVYLEETAIELGTVLINSAGDSLDIRAREDPSIQAPLLAI